MVNLRLLQRRGLITLLFLMLLVPAVQAERPLEELAFNTLQNKKKIQKMTETWSQDEKKMVAEIEQLGAHLDRLRSQSEQARQALEVEEKRIMQQRHRLIESQKLREGLLEWLQDVARRYAAEAEKGLPFLAVEREKRQADLEIALVDPYTPLYEKFRRVFEVLLVETEFGYSSEVYRDNIVLEGESLQVDLLRVGRTALFFRAPDGSGSGFYNPSTQQFELFSDSSVDLSPAFTLVRREAAAEMVSLPMGRIILP
ncbi:DUF3450 family protein [uncultured Desulfuromusa sp.]|uniref:DUF3450 family protein n=1 Tax=uncultured Desulfuromusa sp. TaxID=219183 RepID=UPI002AA7BCB9|nr:DUF3450 family protein [uncultured Desulfuromusa sp.]